MFKGSQQGKMENCILMDHLILGLIRLDYPFTTFRLKKGAVIQSRAWATVLSARFATTITTTYIYSKILKGLKNVFFLLQDMHN